MWVAGVLKGRDRRDVMRCRRNRLFFLEDESPSSTSATGRDRFGDSRVDGFFLNWRGRVATGKALKAKMAESG